MRLATAPDHFPLTRKGRILTWTRAAVGSPDGKFSPSPFVSALERPRKARLRHDLAAFPGPPFYFAPCIELLLGFGLQPGLGAEIGSIDSSSKLRSTRAQPAPVAGSSRKQPLKRRVRVLAFGFTASSLELFHTQLNPETDSVLDLSKNDVNNKTKNPVTTIGRVAVRI